MKKKYLVPRMEIIPFEPQNLLAESPQIIKYVPPSDLQPDEGFNGDDAL